MYLLIFILRGSQHFWSAELLFSVLFIYASFLFIVKNLLFYVFVLQCMIVDVPCTFVLER